MVLLQRFIPIISTIALFFVWWLSFSRKEWFLYFVAAALIIVFLSLAQLLNWRIFSKQFLGFFVLPFLLQGSLASWLVFIDQDWLKTVVMILAIFGYAMYIESCFNYFHHTKAYQPYALANVSSYLGVLTVWLYFSAVSALSIFFQTPRYVLLVFIFIFLVILLLQSMWIENIRLLPNICFFLVLIFVLLQFYWTVLYLPIGWLVTGLVMATLYYFFVNLGKYHLLQSLDSKMVFRYVLVSVLALSGVLATAQWF